MQDAKQRLTKEEGDHCLLSEELAKLHKGLKKREQETAQSSDELHKSKQIDEALKAQIQTLTD